MKALVVYDTKTGNTVKIAQTIANELNCKAKKVSEIKDLKGYDLIGLGSGIYFCRHSKSLLKFVDSAENLKGQEVFLFSTAGMSGKLQHGSLRKKLKKKKAWILDEFSCRGDDKHPFWRKLGIAKGHPNKKDIENAKKFAKELKR